MTTDKYIAVTEAMPATGGTVWWKLREGMSREALDRACETAGIPENERCIPELPKAETLLRRATKQVREYRRLIRPLKGKKAWAIVAENATDATVEHYTYAIVQLRDNRPFVDWTYEGRDHLGATQRYAIEDAINDAFVEQEDILTHGEVSNWLCEHVDRLHAVTLRESGGVYFIPRSGLVRWEQICEALRTCSKTKGYLLPTMKAEDAFEAVFDALLDEAAKMISRVGNAMQTDEEGDGGLGARALQTRIDKSEEFLSKVERYEQLLGVKMGTLHSQMKELQSDVSAAMMALDDDDETNFAAFSGLGVA